MIEILFNGNALQLPAPMGLETFIAEHAQSSQSFAVAINQAFVPRSRYSQTSIQDGDEVEILSPIQGG